MVEFLRVRILLCFGVFCYFCVWPESELLASVNTRVVITSGGSKISRVETSKTLTAVMQEINNVAENKGNIERVRSYFTDEGFTGLKQLVESTGMFTTISEYRTRILETAVGKYEVRAIKVRVKLGDTDGDPVQELVFVLNFRLYIENVHFALEAHHYDRLIREGEKLDDMIYRQQILDFLENFRTAHNGKNIGYLEKAYSDDALIIVGRVLENHEGQGDVLASSSLSQEKIQFIKLKKREYIERLKSVFQSNSFVRVIFDEVEIIRHSKYPEIYGVKLKQRWNSSKYSDEGYLFVMIDFKEPNKPLIHVRSWQPEKFSDGSLVGLGDFEIID